MENKREKLMVIFYVLSLFSLPIIIKLMLDNTITLRYSLRSILIIMICIIIYITSLRLVKEYGYDKSLLKINLIIYFLVYIIMIFNLTLFDEIYGRQGLTAISWNREMLNKYFNNSFNIIPFRTIKLFIRGYNNGIVSNRAFYENIFGNILAFVPFAFFIPLIFKKINNYYKFLIIMIIIVIQIEFLQFITMSGACDIDDVILNLVGSSIAYLMFSIKDINRLMKKIFLLEKEES